MVAASCRWLCQGPSFADCKEVPVAGVSVCAMIGGLAAVSVMMIHFLGTAGLFSSYWTRKPLNLLDLIEKDTELSEDSDLDQEFPEHEETGMALQLRANVVGGLGGALSGSGIDAQVSLVPKVLGRAAGCITWVRIFSMLLHMTAVGMCGTALWLTLLGRTDDVFCAEGLILDVGATVLLILGFLFSIRERRLVATLERNRWQHCDESQAKMQPGSSRPVSGLQKQQAEKSIRQFAQKAMEQAEVLTQPLLEQVHEFPEMLRGTATDAINNFKVKVQEDVQRHLSPLSRLGRSGISEDTPDDPPTGQGKRKKSKRKRKRSQPPRMDSTPKAAAAMDFHGPIGNSPVSQSSSTDSEGPSIEDEASAKKSHLMCFDCR